MTFPDPLRGGRRQTLDSRYPETKKMRPYSRSGSAGSSGLVKLGVLRSAMIGRVDVTEMANPPVISLTRWLVLTGEMR